jgi:lipopolysaccharide export system protein LptA
MKHKIIVILSVIFLVSGLLAQQNSKEPMRILNSDLMEGMETESGMMRIYSGNIRLQHGTVNANSDTAYQYFSSNRAELKGRVVITQYDMILKAPRVFYEGNTGIARADRTISIVDSNVKLTANEGIYNTNNFIADFKGNVRIADDDVVITANNAKYNRQTMDSEADGKVKVDEDSVVIFSNKLFYHRKTRESKNIGNVLIKGKYNNVYLTGDTVINVPNIDYTMASGKPVLFQIDSVSDEGQWKYDTLNISCDTMESYREEGKERYRFINNTEIVRGNLFAKANDAVYFRDNELFFLEGNPVVWFDSTQLHADSIIVYIPDNQIRMIHAFGNALAISRDDTSNIDRKNQIVGYSIKLFFHDNKIEKIESIGNAKSLYFMSSEEGNDGVDRTSCDTLYVYFEDGKPVDVVWLGAVDGEFFPEKMVWDKVKDYFLPNYRWFDEKPKSKKLVYSER